MEIFQTFGVMKKNYKAKSKAKNSEYKYEEIKNYFSYFIDERQDYFGADWVAENWDCLHDYAFNGESYIVVGCTKDRATHKASQWLGDHVFNCINVIKEYEQENFGEVTTDFSDPVRVVDVYVSIIGKKVVAEWKEANPDADTKW